MHSQLPAHTVAMGRKRSKEGQACLDAVSVVYMPRVRLSYFN